MGLGSISLLSALTDKMRWHQTRQGVLAENVANAEMPGYRAKDLQKFVVETGNRVGGSSAQLAAVTTSNKHISTMSGGAASASARASYGYEMTPEGNGVGLEQEMMKVAGNQMDYMAITSLYTRSIHILKLAIGRSA